MARDIVDHLTVVFAAVSAVASCAASVVSCVSLQDTRNATTASQRATVISSVDEAMKAAARDASLAPSLILALRNAAELQRGGVISSDDAAALSDFLKQTKGVAREQSICDAWKGWKARNGHQVTGELQRLVDAAIDPRRCQY